MSTESPATMACAHTYCMCVCFNMQIPSETVTKVVSIACATWSLQQKMHKRRGEASQREQERARGRTKAPNSSAVQYVKAELSRLAAFDWCVMHSGGWRWEQDGWRHAAGPLIHYTGKQSPREAGASIHTHIHTEHLQASWKPKSIWEGVDGNHCKWIYMIVAG